jgi:hypothetical protein
VELAAVIGDEAAWWASDQGVEEHAEGEREQPLRDPLDQPARGLGEVLLEPHLAFEVGDRRFDDEPHAGEATLTLDVVVCADAVGGADQDPFQAQRLRVLAAPEAFVADENGAAVAEGELSTGSYSFSFAATSV